MYVRFNVDKLGHNYLEQLLTLSDGDGYTSSKWEKIPTTGIGETSSFLPIGLASGAFLIEEKQYYPGNKPGTHKEEVVTYGISALSISKISEPVEGRTRIDCHDRKFFFINMDNIKFITLLTGLMNKFSVIKINVDGNVANL